MKNEINPLSKEEIFRLYEQSEFSDIINDERSIYKRRRELKAVKSRFSFLHTIVSAGILAGAFGLITLFRK